MSFPEDPFDERADEYADDPVVDDVIADEPDDSLLTASPLLLRDISPTYLNDRLRDRMRDRMGDDSDEDDDEITGISPLRRWILIIVTLIIIIAMIAMTILPALEAARYNDLREMLPPPTTLPSVWNGDLYPFA